MSLHQTTSEPYYGISIVGFLGYGRMILHTTRFFARVGGFSKGNFSPPKSQTTACGALPCGQVEVGPSPLRDLVPRPTEPGETPHGVLPRALAPWTRGFLTSRWEKMGAGTTLTQRLSESGQVPGHLYGATTKRAIGQQRGLLPERSEPSIDTPAEGCSP
jgi:hypothetical protein